MTVGADQGEIAEVGSPVDIVPVPVEAAARPLRWTSVTISVAAVLLGLFNVSAIVSWQDEQAPGPVADRLRPAVAAWRGATARLRPEMIRASLHDCWNAARAARFGSEQPGEPGTD